MGTFMFRLGLLTAALGMCVFADDASQINELVLANHILSMNGVLDAYGHVSLRSERDPNHFFLARHIPAGTVTRDDIIEYDLDSKQVGGKPGTGYTERFIHGEIYRVRPDVMAVVHCHSPDVIPFTVTNVPLRPMNDSRSLVADRGVSLTCANATRRANSSL